MSTSPDPPARPPRAALPAGDRSAEADNLPTLRSPGPMQQRPGSPPAPYGGGHSGMSGQRSSGYAPSGHGCSSSWFGPGSPSPGPQGPGSPGFRPQGPGSPGFGPQAPVAPGSGPQGYGQSAWQQSSGYSHQGYGNSGPGAPGYNGHGYSRSGYGQSSYGGYSQGGYGSPGYGAQGYGASGPVGNGGAPGYGTSGPGYGTSGPGYGAPGPGYGAPDPGYPAPGARSPRTSDVQSPPGPPQGAPGPPLSPPTGFAAKQGAPPPPPPATEMPEAPAPPTRAEQRPAFTPSGGPRHAAPPPPLDEPPLYDAARHEEALYRRMRGNGASSGSHRQAGPAYADAAPGGTFADPAYGGPARDDAPQATQTFGGGQYGGGPSYDGPGFGGPGFGGPPPRTAERQRRGGRKIPGSRKEWTKGILIGAGVIAVGAGIGAVVAPHLGGPGSDPGCKAYRSSALPAYDRTVGDLNAKARQPALAADLTTTMNDLSSAQGAAQDSRVKSALSGLHGELATVRTDVRKGYIPSSAVTALNKASRTADNAC